MKRIGIFALLFGSILALAPGALAWDRNDRYFREREHAREHVWRAEEHRERRDYDWRPRERREFYGRDRYAAPYYYNGYRPAYNPYRPGGFYDSCGVWRRYGY